MKDKNDGAMETACVCGGLIAFEIKKPNAVTPSKAKILCRACHSSYIVTCTKTADDFNFEFDILKLTPMAEKAAQRAIDARK